MRFGNWRGVRLSVRWAAAAGLAAGVACTDAKAQGLHTIPRLTPAVDLNTGGPYYAPAIPYGHYAGADLGGKLGGLLGGKLHGLKAGLGGHGLGHGGLGHGMGGHGLLGKLKGHGGLGHGMGGFGHGLGHSSTVMASSQQVLPAPQGPVVVGDACGDPGCGLGCGLMDKFKGHGLGGHGLCGGCGGTGCGMCGGLGHLGALHGKLAAMKGLLAGGHKIEWFVGPGGPVPLTPGYVPYVNPVRSPRDFFAFPPMSESASGALPIQASYVPPVVPFTPPPAGSVVAPGMESEGTNGVTPPAPAPAAEGEAPDGDSIDPTR